MNTVLQSILEQCAPLALVRSLAGNPAMEVDEAVYLSERFLNVETAPILNSRKGEKPRRR